MCRTVVKIFQKKISWELEKRKTLVLQSRSLFIFFNCWEIWNKTWSSSHKNVCHCICSPQISGNLSCATITMTKTLILFWGLQLVLFGVKTGFVFNALGSKLPQLNFNHAFGVQISNIFSASAINTWIHSCFRDSRQCTILFWGFLWYSYRDLLLIVVCQNSSTSDSVQDNVTESPGEEKKKCFSDLCLLELM